MGSKLYSRFPQNAAGGDVGADGPIDLLSDTVKFMLRNAHTMDQTGDEAVGDLPADESTASGSGYTAGGITLSSKTYATTSLVTAFKNTVDVVWTIVGSLSTNAGILWDDTPTAPADPLICCDTFGSQTVTDGDFTYSPNASGFFTITVA